MSENPLLLATMQRHAEQLCREHDIVWFTHQRRPGDSYALKECEEINTAPIRGPLSYATVLHEIGHILGRHQQSKRTRVRERWAWKWARSNALVWTPAMERYAAHCLRVAVQRTLGWP
jgi:hypothetical protein